MTSSLNDVLTVRIDFPALPNGRPAFSEWIPCEPEAPGLVKALEFSELIGIAPGDLLTVSQEGIATGILPLDGWLLMVHVNFHEPQTVVEAMAETWNQAAVARARMKTVDVFATDEQWVEDCVRGHPLVEAVTVVRRPGDAVDLSTAVQEG